MPTQRKNIVLKVFKWCILAEYGANFQGFFLNSILSVWRLDKAAWRGAADLSFGESPAGFAKSHAWATVFLLWATRSFLFLSLY